VYARSLYDLAGDAGGQDKIVEIAGELEQICEVARADVALREFLGSPIIDRGRRGESLRRIFSDRVTDLTLRFLLVLNAKGRLGHLEAINAAFDQLVQDAFGRIEVDVITAAPIDDAALETVRSRIGAAMGKEPVLHRYVDPGMIGGIKLRIGDQLIDGSIARSLHRLRHEILSTGGARVRERFGDMIDND
jgi:F-type H+-transporting ATPase subunit delta